jgi:para-nitrobenzyl esterase
LAIHTLRAGPLLGVTLLLLAACGGAAQSSSPSAPGDLGGSAWRLVRFQGGDGTTLTPDDRGKYTIEFRADGSLTARIDCNRGRGTWKSSGPSQLELGPLALTRAMCPPGSLHDRIVKHWAFIRSYVLRDGHLFLALMADGGIYELEPIAGGGSAPPPSRVASAAHESVRVEGEARTSAPVRLPLDAAHPLCGGWQLTRRA